MPEHNTGESSGFVTSDGRVPDHHNVNDWLVWHMTHVENLKPILEAGSLKAFNSAEPRVRIALTGIQSQRSLVTVEIASGYPSGKTLHDHVPFYFAARSPMQYAITKGHTDYRGGNQQLIFIGVRIGLIDERGYTWCFSDRNATIAGAQFRSSIHEIPATISTEILSRRYWHSSPEIDASERRQAEFLILDQVKITDFEEIVTQNPVTLDIVKEGLAERSLDIRTSCQPKFYFEEG